MKTTTCTPTLYSQFAPNRLFRLAESLFNDSRPVGSDWAPVVDVSETDTAYIVRSDIPDIKTEDVKVSLREGVLTIRGERSFEKKTENEKVHIQERSYGSFSRSFSLPKDADAKNVSAAYVNGTLTVTVAKLPEVKPEEIQIRIA